MGSSNLEYDRCFLVCQGCLNNELVGKGIAPRKVDANFRKAELQELELPEVFVEQIAG